MALKHKLESLDGLEDALKALYKPGPDGKGFVLDMDDDPAKETITKLRKERDELEKSIKDREKSEAAAKEAKEREDMERKGDYEKLKASLEADKKALTEKTEALEARLRNGARDRAALEAISAAKGIPKALLPHIKDSLEVIPDGDDLKVIVKGNPGQKLSEYVEGLKAEMPWGFEGSGMAGGGTPPAGGGGSNPNAQYFDPKNANFNYTKQMELAKADPKAFESLRTQFPQPTE